MEKETYNGWSNYATWRVNLELVDGMEWSADEVTFEDIASLKEYIKDSIETMVFDSDNGKSIASDYAQAFLNEVNYHEIAENVISNYPSLITGTNTQDGIEIGSDKDKVNRISLN